MCNFMFFSLQRQVLEIIYLYPNSLTDDCLRLILNVMPSRHEKRAIDYFINSHNSTLVPKILTRQADILQESPDAICTTDDGRSIGLELTSAFAPKGTKERRTSGEYYDMNPVRQVMQRKLKRNYKVNGTDGVWLVIQLRKTLPLNIVTDALIGLPPADNFERVIIQWPVLVEPGIVKTGMYIMQNGEFVYCD